MPHCVPPGRTSHKLINHLVGHILPAKKGKRTGDVSSVFHDLQGKVAHKTFRGKLSDGTPVAVHFDLVQGTVFLGMEEEVE